MQSDALIISWLETNSSKRSPCPKRVHVGLEGLDGVLPSISKNKSGAALTTLDHGCSSLLLLLLGFGRALCWPLCHDEPRKSPATTALDSFSSSVNASAMVQDIELACQELNWSLAMAFDSRWPFSRCAPVHLASWERQRTLTEGMCYFERSESAVGRVSATC